jgi:transcriptional regulator with XRE-family HTH domain
MTTSKHTAMDIIEMQYDVKLAGSIIDLRISASMTQAQLAKKLGTAQSAVARLEGGTVPPSHKMLKRLARLFKVRLEPPTFTKF